MSSSSLNPLPSSDREAATDSATNFPASGLPDFSGLDGLSASSALAAGSADAAEADTFADGTIFDGSFASKLKPKKSPGTSSLLVCSALDATASELSLLAAGSDSLDRSPRLGFRERPPRFESDFEPRSATGSDLTSSFVAELSVWPDAFPAATTDDSAAGSSASASVCYTHLTLPTKA